MSHKQNACQSKLQQNPMPIYLTRSVCVCAMFEFQLTLNAIARSIRSNETDKAVQHTNSILHAPNTIPPFTKKIAQNNYRTVAVVVFRHSRREKYKKHTENLKKMRKGRNLHIKIRRRWNSRSEGEEESI